MNKIETWIKDIFWNNIDFFNKEKMTVFINKMMIKCPFEDKQLGGAVLQSMIDSYMYPSNIVYSAVVLKRLGISNTEI